MHFLGKRTIFAGLLLIAGLATLHGTSKKQIDQYDLTRTYRPYEQLLSGDVNLKERIEREIISCENCGSNEHIMVDADVLRSFITENNKALFTAHRIKSSFEDGRGGPITEAEQDSYFEKQDHGAPEFNFRARCSSCDNEVIINLYENFDQANISKVIRTIVLYTQPAYQEILAIRARKAHLAEEARLASSSSHADGGAYYAEESPTASASGSASFDSPYGHGGGSGAASAYDAENTARQLAEQARIAADRAKAEKEAGDAEMARLQAETARRLAEEIQKLVAEDQAAANEARRERFKSMERVAEAEEARVSANRVLPIPELTTQSRSLFKPAGITTLFRSDRLVVSSRGHLPPGAQFQYKISDYDGTSDTVSLFWRDTVKYLDLDAFTLPVGQMNVQVRIITRDNHKVSAPSEKFKILVKGA